MGKSCFFFLILYLKEGKKKKIIKNPKKKILLDTLPNSKKQEGKPYFFIWTQKKREKLNKGEHKKMKPYEFQLDKKKGTLLNFNPQNLTIFYNNKFFFSSLVLEQYRKLSCVQ